MNCFTEEQLNRISHLIQEIEKLSDVEKLLLYIQLPSGRVEAGKSKFNGTKTNLNLFTKKPDQETTQTYTWILSHLEVDQNVSLPKQEVYDEYKAFCQANRFEPLCVADFGKAMKHAFPCIKPRRLGQRGSSRYCYSGLRKRYKMQPPSLPELIEPTFCMVNDCSQAYNQIIRDCRDNPNECPLNSKPNFVGYGAINLKVDPAIHQDQFHSDYQNPGHRQQQPPPPSNNVTQPDHGGSIESQQRPEGANNKNSQIQTGGNSMAVQSKPISAATGGHYGMPPGSDGGGSGGSSTSQQQTSRAYTYADSIQQPGTPDDDDYQHNYQDLSPVINLFHSGPSQGRNRLGSVSTSDTRPPSTTNFMYQVTNSGKSSALGEHSQTSSTLAPAGNITQSIASQNDQNPQHFQQPVSQQVAAINNNNDTTTTTTNTTNSVIIQPVGGSGNANLASFVGYTTLTHMDGAHIDYCASPFQSPASTPYPVMCNYTQQDMHDYYPPDCMRYSD